MTESDIASSCLESMRKSYLSDGRELFTLDFFLAACPGVDGSELDRALKRLADGHRVRIFYTDDAPAAVIFLPGNDARLESDQHPVNENGQQRDGEGPREYPRYGKLKAILKWAAAILGAIIAAVAAAWIVSRFGW